MTSELVEVHILQLPVSLQVLAGEHTDALRREFALLRNTAGGHPDVPQLLEELIERLNGRFGGLNDEAEDRLALAVERGEPGVDLVFAVPPDAGPAAKELADMLDRADEFCRAGEHLLTLVAPPEVARYREWFLGEFTNQVDGSEPLPWPAFAHSALQLGDTAPPEASTVSHRGAVTLRFDDDLDMQTAPDLREQLHATFVDQPDHVVLDLGRVDFIDSVGIGVILSALRRLSEWGGTLVLRVSPTVRRTLAIAGLDDLLVEATGGRTGPVA